MNKKEKIIEILKHYHIENRMYFIFDIEKVADHILEGTTCKWKKMKDTEDNVYETECDNAFELMNDTPEDNQFKYCPYCGGKIEMEDK